MQGGFSFCGIDIADIGLEYAPDLSTTYVYNPAQKKIHEKIVESHEGGYYYGATAGVKDFTLRCYFEEQNVRNGIMTQLDYYFKEGKTGKLIFDKRPWLWYTATVMSVDTSNLLNFKNGIVTIKMRAYYPYARCGFDTIPIDNPYSNDMMNNSAMLTNSNKMPGTEYGSAGSRITSQTSLILYNPGTQRAKVAIEIAGNVGDGVTIANATTNQLCKFVAISNEITTNAGKYIVSDALNGKTVLTNGTPAETELAFLYHDNGFLELEPAYPIMRNIHAVYTANSTTVTTTEEMTEAMIGKYVYIDGAWRRIAAIQNANALTVTSKPSASGTTATEIVLMNEITVTPISNMSLSRLNFIYSPTFS